MTQVIYATKFITFLFEADIDIVYQTKEVIPQKYFDFQKYIILNITLYAKQLILPYFTNAFIKSNISYAQYSYLQCMQVMAYILEKERQIHQGNAIYKWKQRLNLSDHKPRNSKICWRGARVIAQRVGHFSCILPTWV